MVENVIDIDGERKWTQVIDEARQFSDGVTAYCKRENISKRVYYDWFAKLRPKHPEWQELMKGIKSTGAPQDENGAALLDENIYLCSISTMYRILHENDEIKERRKVSRHRNYAAPELIATGPNEVYSWDITKLKGPEKLSYGILMQSIVVSIALHV